MKKITDRLIRACQKATGLSRSAARARLEQTPVGSRFLLLPPPPLKLALRKIIEQGLEQAWKNMREAKGLMPTPGKSGQAAGSPRSADSTRRPQPQTRPKTSRREGATVQPAKGKTRSAASVVREARRSSSTSKKGI